MVNITINISDTKDCKKRREPIVFSQILNIQDVEFIIKESIAKGDKSIKILINNNLIEYENNNVIRPDVIMLLIIPLKEKILNTESALIKTLVSSINVLKHTDLPQIFWPISQIQSETKELIFNNSSQKNKEELMQIAHSKAFVIN
mgnify:CR=1 FL=1